MDSHFLEKGYKIESSNDKSKYDESMDNDNIFSDYKERDSGSNELDKYNSSKGHLSYDEDKCSKASIFSDFSTNDFVGTCFSSHPDNDISQGEKTCDEFLLNTDEVIALLAIYFKRYSNTSKGALIFHYYGVSHDEVTSPEFDDERVISA